MNKTLTNYLRMTLAIILPTLIVSGIVYAGSHTPPSGTPEATGYTLEDIYQRLTLGTTATEADHDLTIASAPSATMHTLADIYNALSGLANLSDMWNGSCEDASSCPGSEFPGGSQAQGGVDDCNWNNDDGVCKAPPVNRFETAWTPCTEGNDYCGTDDEGAAAKDEATGLVWSYPCAGVGCANWDTETDPEVLLVNCENEGEEDENGCAYYDTDTYYTWDDSGDDNDGLTAQQLCGSQGWSLPHQKQLMQAYIDGAYGNLEPQGVDRYYWSATTFSYDPDGAWYVALSNGYVYGVDKDGSSSVRCVQE